MQCSSANITTTQPSYLHHISLSSLITAPALHLWLLSLIRLPSSSSLQITYHSFHHASPTLWDQLPVSLRQPCTDLSIANCYLSTPGTSSPFINSPLSSFITPPLFHSCFKTRFFHKCFHHRPSLSHRNDFINT